MAKPTWFECITLVAILLGPMLALFAQRLLDLLRENKERRVKLFVTLMRTRATPLAPDHINALNSIDVVFPGERDKQIRDWWSKLLAHIATDSTQLNWQDRYNDLKVDLLREIGLRVGYDYGTDYFKRQVYYPKAFGDVEADALKLRQTLTKVLTEDGLKVQLTNIPSNEQSNQTSVKAP